MTSPRAYSDAGQAFPVYITVVGGLLLLALAYFAVGQAAATRSKAQTAADAAALAAALETRDRLTDQWLDRILEPEAWQDIFEGRTFVPNSCWRAQEFATRNDASVRCEPDGLLGYRVSAETNDTVGETIVPGTADQKATETATAVIKARCSPKPPAADADDAALPNLTCKGGEEWELKPDDPSDLPKPEDLFDVHLADS
ncbi:pilus assembly protein TadG-related protein [Streptomyces sp. WAC8370]|uniref:pilus assembly protein TadG-related protein n=1 Tax=Streptomyces sp. WAC8370 TaxID=3351348 RepID=UPI003F79826D